MLVHSVRRLAARCAIAPAARYCGTAAVPLRLRDRTEALQRRWDEEQRRQQTSTLPPETSTAAAEGTRATNGAARAPDFDAAAGQAQSRAASAETGWEGAICAALENGDARAIGECMMQLDQGAADLESCHRVIRLCEEKRRSAEAVALVQRMHEAGLTPTTDTFADAAHACAYASDVPRMFALLGLLGTVGVAPDGRFFEHSLWCCRRARDRAAGNRIWGIMRGLGLWAGDRALQHMLSLFAHGGEWQRAHTVLREAAAAGQTTNAFHWNTIIAGAVRAGDVPAAGAPPLCAPSQRCRPSLARAAPAPTRLQRTPHPHPRPRPRPPSGEQRSWSTSCRWNRTSTPTTRCCRATRSCGPRLGARRSAWRGPTRCCNGSRRAAARPIC